MCDWMIKLQLKFRFLEEFPTWPTTFTSSRAQQNNNLWKFSTIKTIIKNYCYKRNIQKQYRCCKHGIQVSANLFRAINRMLFLTSTTDANNKRKQCVAQSAKHLYVFSIWMWKQNRATQKLKPVKKTIQIAAKRQKPKGMLRTIFLQNKNS